MRALGQRLGVGFLIGVFCISIRIVKVAAGTTTPIPSTGACSEGDPCLLSWEACNIHSDPTQCVGINDCRDHDGLHCPDDEVCCGHECVCPAPRLRDKAGQCRDCDCPWNELCTAPHGECTCDEHLVREPYSGKCVNCDPDLRCPNCGPDRTCHIHQGNKNSSCECLPGYVEQNGECLPCQSCPRDCDPDHVCITPGFAEPYCGCPPGMNEIDGKCVPCPRCPECTDGKVCVVEGSEAHCECPSGTKPHGYSCVELPHPVFLKRRQEPRYGKENYFGRHGSGHHGSVYYASGNYGSSEYGSGHHGSGNYGSGHHGSGNYGSGHHGSGYYGSGHHGSGNYGSGHHGSGNYGSGHHGSGYYGSGRHGSDHHGSSFQGSGHHGRGRN